MKLVVRQRIAKVYQDDKGKSPFEGYLTGLKDVVGKAKILTRIDRAQKGNFGDHKHLKDGLFEMREDFGPGYRIYFAVEGDEIILLLLAGTKRGQDRDIESAYKSLKVQRERKEKK